MEFEIDSENIEIIIKEDKNKLMAEELNIFLQSSSQTQNFLQDTPNSNTHFTRYEILLKLHEIFFIENIKIIGDVNDFNINKVKFQNISNNIWESASFYNIDSDEILIKKNE